MSGEFIPSIKKYASKNKKNIFLVVLLAVGIFLLAFSSSPDEYDRNSQEESLEAYKARLEEELCELCSSVSGVGKCRVTVTFENGESRVYKGSSLIETKPPKVLGVTVVCKGADSDKVREEIVGMMSALFDIGTNRISVLKLN